MKEDLTHRYKCRFHVKAGSFVDFVNATISGPDYQITVSLKIISEKFAKNEQTEKRGCSSNLVVPPLPRGYQSDLPEIEVGLPIKTDRHSIKFNEGEF